MSMRALVRSLSAVAVSTAVLATVAAALPAAAVTALPAAAVTAAPATAAAPAATAAPAVSAAPATAAGVGQPDPGVVRIDAGRLRGTVADDHVRYSAIPYAAPPVGERRWRPPAGVRPWRGVRDAMTPSPYCPQGGMQGVVGQEDCLYLDVTVPARAGRGDRLPVLVWLHGGGFTSGGAREYDAARLATAGDVIVVSVNYRLGALGFLSAPALDTAGGNYGLMDQAAALRWVRRNASRFGGDPGNVTLAGQSAGARSVCAQLASPDARGMFDRAIVQSGACDNPVPDLAAAQAFGERATADLGCADADATGTAAADASGTAADAAGTAGTAAFAAGTADVAGCLRDVAPEQLVRVLARAGTDLTSRVADGPWNPVAGTPSLPVQPGDALRDGSAARVPLLTGAARDEMRAFVVGETVTADDHRAAVTGLFGADAETVLAEYPPGDDPAVALATVLTDWGGRIGACPALRTADAAAVHQPVYAYEFAEDSREVVDGFPMGAFHGLELSYLWDLDMAWDPYPPLDADQQRLSATMIDYWTAFARTGDPNGPGRPVWPEFGATGAVLGLSSAAVAPTPFAADHRCDLWAALPR
ncbi:carboxylesterase/lipase family protein [Jiangella alba]|uniref:Carboxylic ester hydrolase n=1 Tax=Jiangella alba TaxID=561176 RepID=A0A1H5JQ19_9ACTN|nr:carboxylesterase family protein [Jiangella alba]SEE54629.1 para-nitrobenzyl esterase [Jiangella alba]